MRVFGIGNDIAPVERFQKLIERDESILLQRMFTEDERDELTMVRSPRKRAQACATSFAIKESVYKALGTGLIEGMGWKDVEVSNVFGACTYRVYGTTAELFSRYGLTHWEVSCSSTSQLATAFTILFTKENCYAS